MLKEVVAATLAPLPRWEAQVMRRRASMSSGSQQGQRCWGRCDPNRSTEQEQACRQ